MTKQEEEKILSEAREIQWKVDKDRREHLVRDAMDQVVLIGLIVLGLSLSAFIFYLIVNF